MLAAVETVGGALPVGDARPIVGVPADLARVELCAMSGMPAGDACPTRASEWLPAEAAGGPRCTWHHASDEGLVSVLPAVYDAWARAEGLLPDARVVMAHDERLAPADPSAAGRPNGDADRARLTIVRPLAGAVFLLDPTLRPEFQALTLSARGGAPGALAWFVDGAPAGPDGDTGVVRWPLARGRHDILVRDTHGQTATTRIVVR
jgi:penicillin-binding protein 1C